ncbi:hypothetical protein TEA_023863 [Camellia sinensis var. sinensis]|uniref:Disease resistance R13L4/SHOC-2-like LRR domain-containing protein n=1 Tax=Camellia sinensis var. sinensis TaxID=542762 RepID=A0A4S4EH87_CAMSN|nr:hypothetical protein TEA_023863 [Camellia sinensis var. sinensis]
MDRLVKADVKEVNLTFTRGQKSTATFRLTNLMHTMSVAVSLSTTNPSSLSFPNPFSILPPLSTSSFTLHLSSDHPPLSSPPDTILVRSSMLPTGKAHQDDLRRLFSKPGAHIFKDATIPISLVGPHVIESLFSPPYNKSLEVSFLLSKAISGCDESEIMNLLRSATGFGNSYFVSALIDAGADINHRDSNGQSVVSLARAARIDDVLAMKSCIAEGVNVNGKDQNGWTALHRAAFKGRIESVKTLVSNGAQIDLLDDGGYTPLRRAVERGHMQVAIYLMAHGAKANVVKSNGSLKGFEMVPFNLDCFKNHPSLDVNNLKFLYLSHCYYLTKTPNFSGLNNLGELLIDNCIRLVEIDESIGCFNKLIVLDMANCIKLEQFPSRILMSKSLEYLDLSGCSKLREFAGFKGLLSKSLYTFFSSSALPRKNVDSIGFSLQGLRSLKTLKIANFNMSYLLSEIGSLVSLTHLDLSGNKFLCMLPDSIYNLTRLQRLDMANCNVSYLSSEVGNLISLTHLGLKGNDLYTNDEALADYISSPSPSAIQEEEEEDLNNLKFLYLSHCYYLTKTPNFSGLGNLEELFIDNCIRLVKIDESIGCLSKLIVLDMANCIKLQQLPSRILMLKSLEHLDLSGCAKLREFAGFKGSPSKSLYTFFSSWALPRKNVDSIGFSLHGLRSLKTLNIAKCNVSYLPSEIGSLISLTDLKLYGNKFLCTLPDSICNLTRLERLDMQDCNLSHLPNEIGSLISLTDLALYRNKFLCTLPDNICNLTRLERLDIQDCNLSHLPSEIGSLISLTDLELYRNKFLCTLPDSICNLTRLERLYMGYCNLSHLPSEIGSLISLTDLDLYRNKFLCTLPDSICNLTRLEKLDMQECNLSHLPSEIGSLISLTDLELYRNKFLCTLPDSICNLTRLESLDMGLQSIPELPESIREVHALDCVSLENIELKSLAELLICCKAETLLLQGGPKDLFQSKCMLICGRAKSSRTSVAEQIHAQTQIWADAGVLAGRFWRSLLGVVVADVVACSCCEARLIKDLVQCLMLGLRPDLLYAAESLLLYASGVFAVGVCCIMVYDAE